MNETTGDFLLFCDIHGCLSQSKFLFAQGALQNKGACCKGYYQVFQAQIGWMGTPVSKKNKTKQSKTNIKIDKALCDKPIKSCPTFF